MCLLQTQEWSWGLGSHTKLTADCSSSLEVPSILTLVSFNQNRSQGGRHSFGVDHCHPPPPALLSLASFTKILGQRQQGTKGSPCSWGFRTGHCHFVHQEAKTQLRASTLLEKQTQPLEDSSHKCFSSRNHSFLEVLFPEVLFLGLAQKS